MLSLDDFHPVTLESKPAFNTHYKRFPPTHSDYVFSTLVAWNSYAHYEYMIAEQALFLKTTVNDHVQFRPPIGKFRKDLFDDFLTALHKEYDTYPISMITCDMKTNIGKEYPLFSFVELPDYADYVYRSKDLIDLKGTQYSKIRNRLNKFVKNVPYKTEQISDDNLSDVKRFLKRWCIWRDCEDDPLLSYEKKAVMFSTDHFNELAISGIAIRIYDRIEAVSFFEPMNPTTVVVHFEKGSPHYDGIYKFINKQTALSITDTYTYINRESDMGNPGLRKAKKSYRPDHMIPVYRVQKNNKNSFKK